MLGAGLSASLLTTLLVGGGAAVVAADSPAAPSGLVAAYAFEASSGAAVPDSSGAGNNGTGSGGVWTAEGRYGRALIFNGRTAATQVPDSGSLDLTTAMTVEAWVYPRTLGNAWRTVATKEGSGGISYGLYAASRHGPPAGVVNERRQRTATATSSLPPSTWSHVATTYDGSEVRLYVNGALVDSSSASGPLTQGDGPLRIGGDPVRNEWFDGTLDELRIYNRALTESEIRTDMATPIASSAPDTTAPAAPAGLTATGSTSSSVSFSWSAASDDVGVAGYGVYLGGVAGGSTPSTTYTASGLSCGRSYSFAVDAYDVAGNRSARSATVTATTSACTTRDTQAPTTPASLRVSATTTTSITLGWSAASDNVGVAGYGVYRGRVAGGSTPSTTYTASGLSCGRSYSFAVDAYDAAGNRSARSATVTATTSACTTRDTQAPTTPASLRVSATTTTSITLGWSAAADDVGVSAYGLYRNAAAAGSSTTTSYTFAGLACGTSYTLEVDAVDAAGNRSGRGSVTASSAACAPTAPPDGLTPPARATTVVNAPAGTVVRNDTYYRNPLGNLSYPDNLQRVTVTGAKNMPDYVRNWKDVWVEGTPAAPMNLGPAVNADLMQIKRYPSTAQLPEDLTFRYFRMHDLTRTGAFHSDGLQLMAGRRIRFLDGVAERVDTQPFFVRDSGPGAGGGPIEDITFQRIRVTGSTEAYYAFRIAGDEEAASGGNVPTRVKIIDSSGDKGVSIDAAAAARGSQAINYRRI